MRVVATEVVATDDAVLFAQDFVDLGGWSRQPHYEFLEERARRRLRVHREAREPTDLCRGVMAFVKAQFGDPTQPSITHGRQIGRGCKGTNCRVGADVARRL